MMVENHEIVKKWLSTCWHPGCDVQFYSDSKMRVIRDVVNRAHLQIHDDEPTIHDPRFAGALEFVGKSTADWKTVVRKRQT